MYQASLYRIASYLPSSLGQAVKGDDEPKPFIECENRGAVKLVYMHGYHADHTEPHRGDSGKREQFTSLSLKAKSMNDQNGTHHGRVKHTRYWRGMPRSRAVRCVNSLVLNVG